MVDLRRGACCACSPTWGPSWAVVGARGTLRVGVVPACVRACVRVGRVLRVSAPKLPHGQPVCCRGCWTSSASALPLLPPTSSRPSSPSACPAQHALASLLASLPSQAHALLCSLPPTQVCPPGTWAWPPPAPPPPPPLKQVLQLNQQLEGGEGAGQVAQGSFLQVLGDLADEVAARIRTTPAFTTPAVGGVHVSPGHLC